MIPVAGRLSSLPEKTFKQLKDAHMKRFFEGDASTYCMLKENLRGRDQAGFYKHVKEM